MRAPIGEGQAQFLRHHKKGSVYRGGGVTEEGMKTEFSEGGK
jgi:hypothetical protein